MKSLAFLFFRFSFYSFDALESNLSSSTNQKIEFGESKRIL